MMKKYTLTLIVSLFCLSAFAQNNIRLDPDPFTGVKFTSKYDAYIHPSETAYVMVSGDDLYDENVVVNVENGILHVTFLETYDGLEVHVFTPTLNYLEITGTVEVKTKSQLSGDKLDIRMSGATELQADLSYKVVNALTSGATELALTGSVDSLYIKASGASEVNTTEMQNKYASIIASGASDIDVNPTDVLLADLSGASSLEHKTEPTVKKINEKGAVWHGVAGESSRDTIRLLDENGEVIIIADDLDGLEGLEGLEDLEELGDMFDGFRNKKKFKGNWSGLEIGLNGYMTSANSLDMPTGYEFMELDYPRSFNFSLNPFQQSVSLIGQRLGLVTGLGFRWNNYRFDKDMVISADSIFAGVNEGDPNKDYIKSKLTSVYVTVPLLLEFQTNHKHNMNSFHISAGVIGGLRLMSYSKMVYRTDGGGKSKPKNYDNYFLQPFVLDATARIGWGDLNLYATYSLIEMFRENKGPELYPFSVGFVLPF